MSDDGTPQLTFWNLGSQQVRLDFDGGRIVSDAGLLSLRALEKPLGILADLAQRMPDPLSRSPITLQPASVGPLPMSQPRAR